MLIEKRLLGGNIEQLYARNGRPGLETADELPVRIKARNYVAPGGEEDYEAALRKEYAAYRAAWEGK